MPAHRGSRNLTETGTQDLASLSSTLTRVQRVGRLNTETIARKIGFSIGLELASKRRRSTDVYSEVTTLFRRLSLGKITLRKWDPVIFVTHDDANEKLEAAFGEGILEGIMHERSKDCAFFKHSTSRDKPRGNTIRLKPAAKGQRVENS